MQVALWRSWYPAIILSVVIGLLTFSSDSSIAGYLRGAADRSEYKKRGRHAPPGDDFNRRCGRPISTPDSRGDVEKF
jgi:hypothetical protein